MADDEQKASTNEGIKTEDGQQKADDSQASVDKAELEQLRAQAGRMDGLDKIAKEASNDGEELKAEDYVNLLEDHVYRESTAKPEPKPEEKPAAPTEPAKPEATPNPDIEEAKRMALQSQQTSNTTMLAVQFADFREMQRELPEDQRSSLGKNDLNKIIMSKEDQATVMHVAKNKFDNNVYAAANYIHALTHGEDLLKKAREDGANSEAAKELARVSAQLPGNVGRVAEPTTDTPEQKRQKENDRLADDIAPDTAYIPQA